MSYIIDIDISDRYKTSYLNAELDKKVYIEMPQGDKNYEKDFWKLNKALYELKQTECLWYNSLGKKVVYIGFLRQKMNPVFIYKNNLYFNCICE